MSPLTTTKFPCAAPTASLPTQSRCRCHRNTSDACGGRELGRADDSVQDLGQGNSGEARNTGHASETREVRRRRRPWRPGGALLPLASNCSGALLLASNCSGSPPLPCCCSPPTTAAHSSENVEPSSRSSTDSTAARSTRSRSPTYSARFNLLLSWYWYISSNNLKFLFDF